MNTHQTISKEKPVEPSQDFDALYKEGIQWIQQYSGDTWTDYNIHDPGITILEYLCFGITDVGYRCSFPVTDILFSSEGNQLDLVDNAFFPLHQIMPCAPLTISDYRKLFLDHLLADIDNIWIERVNTSKNIGGLYHITIQLNAETAQNEREHEAYRESVKAKVRQLFMAHRNLGEDLHSIAILKAEPLAIEGTIRIAADASAEQVLADLIHGAEHFLAPRPRLYSFSALKSEGKTTNEILDGPSIVHGFIQQKELKPVVSAINIAQLRDKIMSVNGIKNIEIKVKIQGIPQLESEIALTEGTYFELDKKILNHNDNSILIFRNEQPVRINKAEVEQILLAYSAQEHQGYKHRLDLRKPTPRSQKDLKEIGTYHSIQRLFPAVYGIGAYGLPRNADALRQAQAQQLKGYLAIFETMFAGYLKQITQLRDLFSTGKPAEFVPPDALLSKHLESNNTVPTTQISTAYFAQFPFDIPDILPLIATSNLALSGNDGGNNTSFVGLSQSALEEKINQQLASFTDINDRTMERRNLFLDHLLARFGEVFNSDLLAENTDTEAEQDVFLQNVLEAKCALLREYDLLSRQRGIGVDYTQPQETWEGNWSAPNVCWLKKQICMRLNITDCSDRSTTHYFPFNDLEPPQMLDTKAAQAATYPPLSLHAILRDGHQKYNYEIENEPNESTVWFRENTDTKAFVLSAGNAIEADRKLNNFLDNLAAFKAQSSNFYVIEHILLRPSIEQSEKLTFCVPLEHLKETLCLESIGGQLAHQIKLIARDLLPAASDIANYTTQRDLDAAPKRVYIQIEQDGQVLVRSQASYPVAKAAEYIKALFEHMKEVLNNPKMLDEMLQITALKIQSDIIPDEFYNHQMSIVAPAWGTFFMNEDKRAAFKHLVGQLAPAHLYMNFHWLNWEKMKAFEPAYTNWLKTRSQTDKQNAAQKDAAAFALSEKLYHFDHHKQAQ